MLVADVSAHGIAVALIGSMEVRARIEQRRNRQMADRGISGFR